MRIHKLLALHNLQSAPTFFTMPPDHQTNSCCTCASEGPRVTKKDLAKAIASELNITALDALRAVQMTLDGIRTALVEKGRIELRNFGVFEVRKRKPRKARNPRTGEKVKVPAKMVVAFKPGREMQDEIGKLKMAPHSP